MSRYVVQKRFPRGKSWIRHCTMTSKRRALWIAALLDGFHEIRFRVRDTKRKETLLVSPKE